MQQLLEFDRIVFVWLNSFHTPLMNTIMLFITKKQSWYFLYAILVLAMLIEDNRIGFRKITLILMSVLCSDQFCSGLLKPVFQRLRPCQTPDLMSVVHLVGDCGGLYGFASSHAANSFALATMIYFFYKNTGIKSWFLFLWAAIVSYSRIYVGVHYLSDVIVGAMVGIFFYKLIFNISKKYSFIN